MKDAGSTAGNLTKGIGDGAKAAGTAKSAADGLSKSLDAGKAPAGDIAKAFVSIGGKSPEVVKFARDFAGWLDKARTISEKIQNIK